MPSMIGKAINPGWTPTNLAVASRVWIYAPDASFTGSNLTSITSRGSDAAAMTLIGTPTKGTVGNGVTPIKFAANGQALSQTVSAWGAAGFFSAFVFGKLNTVGVNGVVNRDWQNANLANNHSAVWYPSISGFGTLCAGDRSSNVDAAPDFSTDSNLLPDTAVHSASIQAGTTNLAWSDGTSVAISTINFTPLAGPVPNYISSTWQFGQALASPAGEGFDGDLFTFLMFDYNLTTTVRQQLEGWAWWAFTGGAAGLPSNHPNKNSPPFV